MFNDLLAAIDFIIEETRISTHCLGSGYHIKWNYLSDCKLCVICKSWQAIGLAINHAHLEHLKAVFSLFLDYFCQLYWRIKPYSCP